MAVKGNSTGELDLSFVHVLPKPKVELYAVYKLTEYQRIDIAVEDANLLVFGSRVIF